MLKVRKRLLAIFAIGVAAVVLVPAVLIQALTQGGLPDISQMLQDTDPNYPVALLLINEDATYTRDGLVTANIFVRAAENNSQPLKSIRLLSCLGQDNCDALFPDSPQWQDWRDLSGFSSLETYGGFYFATEVMLTDPQSSGLRSICIQAKDINGEISKQSEYSCDSIVLDNTAPNGSAEIEDGVAETHSLDLWGTITAQDPLLADGTSGAGGIEYSVSGDNIPWQPWQKMNGDTRVLFGSYPIAVTSPTVIRGYVKLRDQLGNESQVFSDDILYVPATLDGIPPSNPPTESTFWINSGGAFTDNLAVTLHFAPAKEAKAFKIWNKGENSDLAQQIDYKAELSWQLLAGFGEKRVYVQYFYADGTSSEGIPAGVIYASMYSIEYSPAIAGYSEYTIGNVPNMVTAERPFNFVLSVKNTGSLSWDSNHDSKQTGKPTVHVAYHWYREWHDGTRTLYDYQGNRGGLNSSLDYMQSDNNVRMQINAPSEPGTYILQFDAVREAGELDDYFNRQDLTGKQGDWFSNYGNPTPEYRVEIVPIQNQALQPGQDAQNESFAAAGLVALQGSGLSSQPQHVDPLQSDSSVQTLGAYYTVQAPKPWDLSWRCAGYDCYSGIAEEFYQCTSKGLPNDVPNTANRLELQNKCWWPIFAYNELKYINQIPLQYKTQPWNFLQVGWLLYIPGAIDRKPPVPKPPILPELPNGFEGLPGTTPQNPWNGYNGATSAYPRVTFDRYIAWDGSYKTDQIKWSETDRPVAPTITAMQTNESATAVTVYGVGIPKNHPLEVRVWNEYRYCWGCGSGWEFASRLSTAQHVKIVLFTDKWQYLGEVWNDSPDGKWQITLPLGGSIQPGSRIFAEVQIQADYSFILHWWADTYETAKFDLRDSKYTGYPYFASGAGNIFTVPEARMTDLAEWAFRYREILSGNYQIVSGKHQFCGVWIKDYAYLTYRGDTWQTYTNLIFNPQLNWAFRLRGDIRLKYWDSYGGVCGNLGLPVTDDLIASPSPLGTQGAYQKFTGGDIYSSTLGTYVVKGVIKEEFDKNGGTAYYGYPKGNQYYKDGELKQDFEVIDRQISIAPCGEGMKWDNDAGECVLPKEWDCRQIGMHTFTSSQGEVVCAKVLDVPYFNQWLEPDGVTKNPADGWQMCGAASATMVAAYFQKVPISGYTSTIKSYMYQDQGQKIAQSCGYNKGGAFGLTNFQCNQNWDGGMVRYMEHTGLKYEFIAGWEVDRNGRPIKDRGGLTLEKVKQSIDDGRPIIVQAKGHFYLIKGYTEAGKVVVNDSWTDRSVGVSYSLQGNNAVYEVNNSPYTVIKAAEYYL